LDVGSGDKVIIGAGSEKHLEKNLLDFEKGSLPDDTVQGLDEVWRMAKRVACSYYL
jgi:aflatoxin B1 aldehyde reductase